VPPAAKKARPAWRRPKIAIPAALVLVLLVTAGPPAWTWASSLGHRYAPAHAPSAPVGIVFGAELFPGGQKPKAFLAGRLDVAAQLFQAGKVKAVLVSGDAGGTSGNETAVMTRYLTEHGVPANHIAADPHGLDTYDTCARAIKVYGVRKALLISQGFHLPRAVTICRRLGMDADGVEAVCNACPAAIVRKNVLREIPADVKAVWDVGRHRDPAVVSGPDPSLTNALRG
jgi:vancomycin permeability regulator SanA